MKVAITSTGNSLESTLDNRFGRCLFFVIYDTDTGSTEFIPNPNLDHVEGAGPASVQLVASRGVQQVVSGEFGSKVKSIFDKLRIQLIVLQNNSIQINEIIQLLHQKKQPNG